MFVNVASAEETRLDKRCELVWLQRTGTIQLFGCCNSGVHGRTCRQVTALPAVHASHNFLMPKHTGNLVDPTEVSSSKGMSLVAHACDKHDIARSLSGSEPKDYLSCSNQFEVT